MVSLNLADTGAHAKLRSREVLLNGHGSKPVFILFVIISLLCFSPLVSTGTPPQWWTDYEILDSQAAADDYAAANQGQLKHTATQAREYFDDLLAVIGGAGPEIDALVTPWLPAAAAESHGYAINQGQLKAVASLFYNRLNAIGMSIAPPWGSSHGNADDYAMANLGQLKNVFSFEIDGQIDLLSVDANANGIPDWWEITYFGTLLHGYDPSDDLDNDGQTLLEESLAGLNPLQPNHPAVGLRVW